MNCTMTQHTLLHEPTAADKHGSDLTAHIFRTSTARAWGRLDGLVEQFPNADEHGSEIVSLEIWHGREQRIVRVEPWRTTIQGPRHALLLGAMAHPFADAVDPPLNGIDEFGHGAARGQILGLFTRTCRVFYCCRCCWRSW